MIARPRTKLFIMIARPRTYHESEAEYKAAYHDGKAKSSTPVFIISEFSVGKS